MEKGKKNHLSCSFCFLAPHIKTSTMAEEHKNVYSDIPMWASSPYQMHILEQQRQPTALVLKQENSSYNYLCATEIRCSGSNRVVYKIQVFFPTCIIPFLHENTSGFLTCMCSLTQKPNSIFSNLIQCSKFRVPSTPTQSWKEKSHFLYLKWDKFHRLW